MKETELVEHVLIFEHLLPNAVYGKLKPTGKYRYITNRYGVVRLEIQHQGLIFKRWVDSYDIKLMPVEKNGVVEYDCSKRG